MRKQEIVRQEQERKNYLEHQRKMRYDNEPKELAPEDTKWTAVAPGKWLRYEQFKSDADLPMIVDLFTRSLSEPYTVFTYQFFIHTWPDLCIMCFGLQQDKKPDDSARGDFIGCVVSKVSRKRVTYDLRGYVAMLAVEPSFRGHRIGSHLVVKSVDLMKAKGCLTVGLETPITNDRALTLYTSLGFVKTKYLERYYMDGSNAIRLKLWLQPPQTVEQEEEGAATAQEAVASE